MVGAITCIVSLIDFLNRTRNRVHKYPGEPRGYGELDQGVDMRSLEVEAVPFQISSELFQPPVAL